MNPIFVMMGMLVIVFLLIMGLDESPKDSEDLRGDFIATLKKELIYTFMMIMGVTTLLSLGDWFPYELDVVTMVTVACLSSIIHPTHIVILEVFR